MSDEPTKPAGAATPFSAEEAMAFMQRMWNPFALPMPGAGPAPQDAAPAGASATMPGMMAGMMPFPNPAAMFAALDPAEVDRKIGELRIIEGWLAMTLNLMQMSIKTLELQRASLEALQGAHAPASTGRKAGSRPRKA